MTTIYRGIVPDVTIDMLCYWLHSEAMGNVIVNWAYSESETDESAAHDLDRSNWRVLWLNTKSPYFAHLVILAPLKGHVEEFHREFQQLTESDYVSAQPQTVDLPSLPKGLMHRIAVAAERDPGILWREGIARIGELRAEQRHFAKVRIVLMENESGLFADILMNWLQKNYGCTLTTIVLTEDQQAQWDKLDKLKFVSDEQDLPIQAAEDATGLGRGYGIVTWKRLRNELGVEPPRPVRAKWT